MFHSMRILRVGWVHFQQTVCFFLLSTLTNESCASRPSSRLQGGRRDIFQQWNFIVSLASYQRVEVCPYRLRPQIFSWAPAQLYNNLNEKPPFLYFPRMTIIQQYLSSADREFVFTFTTGSKRYRDYVRVLKSWDSKDHRLEGPFFLYHSHFSSSCLSHFLKANVLAVSVWNT